jgi:hypothetical protein
MMQTLRDFAIQQLDAFTREYGPRAKGRSHRAMDAPSGRYRPDARRHLRSHAGGVARQRRGNEKPFEMCLAIPCDGTTCKLAHPRARVPGVAPMGIQT